MATWITETGGNLINLDAVYFMQPGGSTIEVWLAQDVLDSRVGSTAHFHYGSYGSQAESQAALEQLLQGKGWMAVQQPYGFANLDLAYMILAVGDPTDGYDIGVAFNAGVVPSTDEEPRLLSTSGGTYSTLAAAQAAIAAILEGLSVETA